MRERTQEVFAADDSREIRDELERVQTELARSRTEAIRNQEAIVDLHHQLAREKALVAQEHQKLEDAIADQQRLHQELKRLKGRRAAAERKIVKQFIRERLYWLWVIGVGLVLLALATAMVIGITHPPPFVTEHATGWHGRRF